MHLKNLFSFTCLFLVTSFFSFRAEAQKTPFTVADAIQVKSMGSQNLSDDGKYLAGIISDGSARFETDHFRFQDPSYWNVPGGNSRELYYAMRRLGKDVTWVNYLNGGHGAGAASNESDFHDHWKRVFDFYEKHFNNEKEK